jgi:hypothetical protein
MVPAESNKDLNLHTHILILDRDELSRNTGKDVKGMLWYGVRKVHATESISVYMDSLKTTKAKSNPVLVVRVFSRYGHR